MADEDKREKEMHLRKLHDVKSILKKVLLEKDELREQQAEESVKVSEKVKDLKTLLAFHENKIKNLDTEIKAFEENIKMKQEVIRLMKIEAEKADKESREKIEKYWKNYNEAVSLLENEVKNAYLVYQKERDAKLLLGGLDRKLKGDIKKSIQKRMLKEKKKLDEKRAEDMKEEQAKLSEETKAALEAVDTIKKKKQLLQRQNQSLKEALSMAKEAELKSRN